MKHYQTLNSYARYIAIYIIIPANYTHLTLIPRGYTGHEMLWHFALINMNGHVYEPITSRFLYPDNYVRNLINPLKYMDPDGEWVQFVTGSNVECIEGYLIGKQAGLSGWEMVGTTLAGSGINFMGITNF